MSPDPAAGDAVAAPPASASSRWDWPTATIYACPRQPVTSSCNWPTRPSMSAAWRRASGLTTEGERG